MKHSFLNGNRAIITNTTDPVLDGKLVIIVGFLRISLDQGNLYLIKREDGCNFIQQEDGTEWEVICLSENCLELVNPVSQNA